MKREKEALLKIVGQMVVDQKLEKKPNVAMALNQLSPAKSKTTLACELDVSRSSLYYKPKLPEKDLKLKAEIEQVMADNKTYGHRRVAWALNINKKRARRVMKLFRLKPHRRRRKRPPKPKDANQAPMAVPNLISGTIIDAPNQVWVSDSTYLPYFGRMDTAFSSSLLCLLYLLIEIL